MDYKLIVENVTAVLCENSGTSMSLDSLCLKTLERMGKTPHFLDYGCPKIPGVNYDMRNQRYEFTYPIANNDQLDMYAYILVVVAFDDQGSLLADPHFAETEQLYSHLRFQTYQVARYLRSLM